MKNVSDRLRDKFSSVFHLPRTTYSPDRNDSTKKARSANTPQSQAWREMPRRATVPFPSPNTSPMPNSISKSSSAKESMPDRTPTWKPSRSHSAPSLALSLPPPLPRLKDSLAPLLPSRPAETHQQDAPPRRKCLFPTKEERNSTERRHITAESENCRAELVKQGIRIRDFQFEEDCRRMIADQQWEKRLSAEGLSAGVQVDECEVFQSRVRKNGVDGGGGLNATGAAEDKSQDTMVMASRHPKSSEREAAH